MYRIVYTKQAVKDIPKLKAAHLDKKADGTGITLAIPEGIGSPVLKHVSMYGLERIIGLGVGA